MLLNIGHICSVNFPSEIMILWSVLSENVCHVLCIYTRRYLKNLDVLESTGSCWAICRNVKQFDIGTENYVVQDDKLQKNPLQKQLSIPPVLLRCPGTWEHPLFQHKHTLCNYLTSILSSVVSSCPAPHLTFALFDFWSLWEQGMFLISVQHGDGWLRWVQLWYINKQSTYIFVGDGIRNNRQQAMKAKTIISELLLRRDTQLCDGFLTGANIELILAQGAHISSCDQTAFTLDFRCTEKG